MYITDKKRQAVMHRLTTDTEWAETELGQLSKILIDTNAVPISILATYVGKPASVVQRWIDEIHRPGNTDAEAAELDIKFRNFREALTSALALGELPTPLPNDELLSVITSRITQPL